MSSLTGVSCHAWMIALHASYALHWVGLTKHVVSLLFVERLPRLPNTIRPASAGLHSCNLKLVVSNHSSSVCTSAADCNMLSVQQRPASSPWCCSKLSPAQFSETSMSASATCQSNPQTTSCLRRPASCRQHVAQPDCRALVKSKTSILSQKHPFYSGNVHSETAWEQ